MAVQDFLRARNPAQKEARRVRLLATAASLLQARGDVQSFSLNELAREAGMAKSNVYRYFESREALLLALLEDRWRIWFEAFQAGVDGDAPDRDLMSWCEKIALSVAEDELLCSLMSALPSVLEHNVSIETIHGFKSLSLGFVAALAEYSHRRCPELSAAEYAELFHHFTVVMTSLWSYSNPSETVREALRDPGLAPFQRDFPRDLTRSLQLLARGMKSASSLG